MDLLGVLDLQRQQYTHDFQRKIPPIHIIAQEKVVSSLNVTPLPVSWIVVLPKKPHQITILPVDISIDLNWSPHFQHHRLLLQNLQYLITQLRHLVGIKEKKIRSGVRLPGAWLEQPINSQVRDATNIVGRRGRGNPSKASTFLGQCGNVYLPHHIGMIVYYMNHIGHTRAVCLQYRVHRLGPLTGLSHRRRHLGVLISGRFPSLFSRLLTRLSTHIFNYGGAANIQHLQIFGGSRRTPVVKTTIAIEHRPDAPT
mmetsp:Transcript_22430/g.49006  ORF Transcript_22430/g.49006 Transcript_22430/m.49006 type:complete len:255 (-) Transcript_22430:991-1755(-)